MRKKKRKSKRHSPERKKVVRLVGDLKATKRLIKYAEKIEGAEPERTLHIGYLKMLGARIAHDATEAITAWDKTRASSGERP